MGRRADLYPSALSSAARSSAAMMAKQKKQEEEQLRSRTIDANKPARSPPPALAVPVRRRVPPGLRLKRSWLRGGCCDTALLLLLRLLL